MSRSGAVVNRMKSSYCLTCRSIIVLMSWSCPVVNRPKIQSLSNLSVHHRPNVLILCGCQHTKIQSLSNLSVHYRPNVMILCGCQHTKIQSLSNLSVHHRPNVMILCGCQQTKIQSLSNLSVHHRPVMILRGCHHTKIQSLSYPTCQSIIVLMSWFCAVVTILKSSHF